MTGNRKAMTMMSILFIVTLLIIPLTAFAVVPTTINYQGYLTDAVGNPLNGSINVAFAIYNAAIDGTLLWSETLSVDVGDGIFSTYLGTTSAFPDGFWEYPVFLGITIGTDAEMTPRQRLRSVAYAMRTAVAEMAFAVSAGAIDASMLSDGAVNSDKIADGSITGADIANSTITSSNIATGAVTSLQIADNAVTASDIADGSGSGLDADVLDGNDSSAFFILGENETVSGIPAFNGGVSGSFAPFTVDSTYQVANLNADQLDSYHAADFSMADHSHDVGTFTTGMLDNSRFSAYSDLGSENLLDNDGDGDLLTRVQSDGRYAGLSHGHSAVDITGGTLSTDRYTAYDDLSTENFLDNNADSDLLTRVQSDVRYATSSHEHSAAEIFSGTLDPARFSAIADLNAEASIGSAADQVAAGDHNHNTLYSALGHGHSALDITSDTLSTSRYSAYSDLSSEGYLNNSSSTDILTRSQSDSRYYSQAYVDGMEERIDALEALLSGVSRSGNNIYFSNVNVHVRSGSGETDGTVNGTGNLIVGYNELRGSGDNRTGSHNIVVGSNNNYTSYGGLVGGKLNNINNGYAAVVSGYSNTASGTYSAVLGGRSNTANEGYTSVSGGYANVVSTEYSTVLGGIANQATGLYSSVAGGRNNIASGDYSFVGGGGNSNAAYGNEAAGDYSAILGGEANTAEGYLSAVVGGNNNHAFSRDSSILGGRDNTAGDTGDSALGWYSTIAGGAWNITKGTDSNISGGINNIAEGQLSAISGGDSGFTSGFASSISGGYLNQATNQFSSVSGGRSNIASGSDSSVTGGTLNEASNAWSTVSGGRENVAGGQQSVVSGGYQRSTTGLYNWRGGTYNSSN